MSLNTDLQKNILLLSKSFNRKNTHSTLVLCVLVLINHMNSNYNQLSLITI